MGSMGVNPGRGDLFPELDDEPFRSRAIAEALADEAREKLGETAKADAGESVTDAFMLATAKRAVETQGTRKRLLQDRAWTDADGNEHEIARMEPRYAANVLRFLERRAVWLHAGETAEWLFLAEPNGEQASNDFHDEMHRLYAASPVAWLNGQPLVVALRERAGDAKGGPSRRWLARHPLIAAKVIARRVIA